MEGVSRFASRYSRGRNMRIKSHALAKKITSKVNTRGDNQTDTDKIVCVALLHLFHVYRVINLKLKVVLGFKTINI